MSSKADSDLARYIQLVEDDPRIFFDDILRFKPLDWQIEGIEAVFDVRRKAQGKPTKVNHDGKPRVSIRSGHGPGKTQFLAMLIHVWNFTTHGLVACTAPKEAQLKSRLLPRYRKCMANAIPDYREWIDIQAMRIVCGDDQDHGAQMETASDPENLAGYHDTPQLFLVDEASARRLDPMFPVIEGALTTPGSVCVEIGNPTRIEGEFYNHHMRPNVRDLYYRMHVKPEDAPELIGQEWVDNMITKYGRNSPVTLIRVFGEFAAFDEYILIPPEYIDDMLDVEEVTDGSHPRLRVSVDVADGGADSTVITVCKHYDTFVQIVFQKAYWWDTGKAPIEAAKTAAQLFDTYGGNTATGDDIVVDGVGVGAGTVGKLLELGYSVINFKAGASSSDTAKWRNKRVQAFMVLLDRMTKGEIKATPDSIDDPEELRAHLLSIKRRVSNERVDDLESKEQIRKAGLPSPDRADSLMMQMAGDAVMHSALDMPISVGELESLKHEYF